jgi:hypothetical protein
MKRQDWRLVRNLAGFYLTGLIVLAFLVWMVLAIFGKADPPLN